MIVMKEVTEFPFFVELHGVHNILRFISGVRYIYDDTIDRRDFWEHYDPFFIYIVQSIMLYYSSYGFTTSYNEGDEIVIGATKLKLRIL